jgi:hypothetical protein
VILGKQKAISNMGNSSFMKYGERKITVKPLLLGWPLKFVGVAGIFYFHPIISTMNQSNSFQSRPLFTPAAYLLVLISLLLPFCHIKCGEMKIASIQGTDMIFKGKISLSGSLGSMAESMPGAKENLDGEDKDRNADINIWVILVAVVALAGMGLYFGKVQPQQKIHLFVALGGLLALILFWVTKNSYFDLDGLGGHKDKKDGGEFGAGGLVSIGMGIGYWLCALGFAAVALLHFNKKPALPAKTDMPPTEPLPDNGDS